MTSRSCVPRRTQKRSPREPCKITWSQRGQREEREGGPGRSFSRGPPPQKKRQQQHLQTKWWSTMTRRSPMG
eukprot:5149364-Amphidinium_carterae.1